MADEIAVDSFLNLLGQSELVSDDQLVALMAEFRGDSARWTSSREMANELIRREILTAWQADMLLQKKNRGFRLGQYRILRPLGQGGMSKVFLAEHETMRRRSAIKILPSKYEGDADLLNRFRLEAIAVARLDHPNIVRAWDFNKDVRYGKEIHYLAMEYVDGLDLRRMVEEYGPLDYRTAADCIAQAAEGLAQRARGRLRPPRYQAGQSAGRFPRRVEGSRLGAGHVHGGRGGRDCCRGGGTVGGGDCGLRGPRAGPGQPERGLPRRHLWSWLHVLFPVDRTAAFSQSDGHGNSDRPPGGET